MTVRGLAPFLAHTGEGSAWQALLVALSLGFLLVALLVVLGRIELRGIDDLVLPLAAVAIVSSLAPLADRWLSDLVGWALPAGVVALVGLLVAALTSLELRPTSPLTAAVVVLAIAGGALLYRPLTIAWHPPPEFLPDAGDATIAFVVPEDGDVIEAGTVDVAVVATGGTIGPGDLAADEIVDPTEAGTLRVTRRSPPDAAEQVVDVETLEDCTVDAPCATVTFPVELEAGDHRLRVEFLRGDGMPFDQPVFDRVDFTSR